MGKKLGRSRSAEPDEIAQEDVPDGTQTQVYFKS